MPVAPQRRCSASGGFPGTSGHAHQSRWPSMPARPASAASTVYQLHRHHMPVQPAARRRPVRGWAHPAGPRAWRLACSRRAAPGTASRVNQVLTNTSPTPAAHTPHADADAPRERARPIASQGAGEWGPSACSTACRRPCHAARGACTACGSAGSAHASHPAHNLQPGTQDTTPSRRRRARQAAPACPCLRASRLRASRLRASWQSIISVCVWGGGWQRRTWPVHRSWPAGQGARPDAHARGGAVPVPRATDRLARDEICQLRRRCSAARITRRCPASTAGLIVSVPRATPPPPGRGLSDFLPRMTMVTGPGGLVQEVGAAEGRGAAGPPPPPRQFNGGGKGAAVANTCRARAQTPMYVTARRPVWGPRATVLRRGLGGGSSVAWLCGA